MPPPRAGSVALLALSLIALGACNYAAPRYSVSVENVTMLRGLRRRPIGVGKFVAKPMSGGASVPCRAGGQINTPDGEPFSQYVRAALISELEMAEAYSASAPVTLTGTLDHVDSNSLAGTWTIALTVASSNGRSIAVEEKYSFGSSFAADVACPQTAQALMPAVQNVIAKLVHDPGFAALVDDAETSQVNDAPKGTRP